MRRLPAVRAKAQAHTTPTPPQNSANSIPNKTFAIEIETHPQTFHRTYPEAKPMKKAGAQSRFAVQAADNNQTNVLNSADVWPSQSSDIAGAMAATVLIKGNVNTQVDWVIR